MRSPWPKPLLCTSGGRDGSAARCQTSSPAVAMQHGSSPPASSPPARVRIPGCSPDATAPLLVPQQGGGDSGQCRTCHEAARLRRIRVLSCGRPPPHPLPRVSRPSPRRWRLWDGTTRASGLRADTWRSGRPRHSPRRRRDCDGNGQPQSGRVVLLPPLDHTFLPGSGGGVHSGVRTGPGQWLPSSMGCGPDVEQVPGVGARISVILRHG